jgi:hypothetical protein
MVIKQLYVSGDNIWAGTAVRSGANINSGLYFTSNGGSNWLQLDSVFGSGIAVGMEYKGEGEMFLVKGLGEYDWAGNVYKTTDNGFSWDTINISNNGIKWVDTSPFNQNEMYALDVFYYPSGVVNTLFKSTNSGNTWQDISAFPISSHGSALEFAFDLIDSMNLYVTVDTNFDQYLYKSTNKGENWFFISTPPIRPLIFTDYFITDRIYLFPQPYISNNGGQSWFLADSGLTDTSYYLSFYQDKEITRLLYTLRYDGLYSSRNDTIYWHLVDGTDNLPIYFGPTGFYVDYDMHNIFIEPKRKELFIGTAEGIYKATVITTVKENNKNELDFSLSQNFPNPFNSSTIIEYQINITSFVSVKVYDVLGKEIAILVNEEKYAGNYLVRFNSIGLPSGIYFYRFHAGKFIETRKMVLTK